MYFHILQILKNVREVLPQTQEARRKTEDAFERTKQEVIKWKLFLPFWYHILGRSTQSNSKCAGGKNWRDEGIFGNGKESTGGYSLKNWPNFEHHNSIQWGTNWPTFRECKVLKRLLKMYWIFSDSAKSFGGKRYGQNIGGNKGQQIDGTKITKKCGIGQQKGIRNS